MSKSVHEPVHANPNQGESTMPSTSKKKTSAATSPPTTTAASSSPPPIGATTVTSASPGTSKGKAQVINGLVMLVGALTANYAESATFELPSGTFTLPELIQALNAYIAVVSAVGTAGLAYHLAVEKEESMRASAFALRSEVKAVVAARVGKSATAMASYGFVPAKTPSTSPKALVARAVKAEATRTARGTMGSKQKQEITGNVTGVAITPITPAAAQANTPVAATVPPATSGGTGH